VAVADIPPGLPNVVAAFAVLDPRTGNVEALVAGHPATDQFDDAPRGSASPAPVSSCSRYWAPSRRLQRLRLDPGHLALRRHLPGVPLANGYNLTHLMNNDPGDPVEWSAW